MKKGGAGIQALTSWWDDIMVNMTYGEAEVAE